MSMFHVKHILNSLRNLKIHELLFYVFLFFIPIQTRILYNPGSAYIDWYFNYHLAFFVYLSDLILILSLVTWFIFDRPKLHVKQGIWLILAFFIFMLISLLHVKHLDFGLYTAFRWIELLFLVFYVKHEFREVKQFHIGAWLIFLSSIVQAGIGLIQFHVQHGMGLGFLGEYIAPMGTSGLATISHGTEKVIRAYGTMPHPNILGAFLVFGLLMSFFIVSRETNLTPQRSFLKPFLVSCGTILITFGIFVTFSRLAWIAAAIAYLAYTIYVVRQRSWNQVKLTVAVGIVSCATILIGGYTYLGSRVLDSNPAAVTDRGVFNHFGLTLVSQHPVLGVGAGNYVPALQGLVKLESWQYQPAHNIFIFITAELGIVGLFLFVWLLFQIFRGAWRAPRGTLRFTLLLLGIIFLLLGQFDHYFVTIQQGRLMFFMMIGLVAALANLTHEKISN